MMLSRSVGSKRGGTTCPRLFLGRLARWALSAVMPKSAPNSTIENPYTCKRLPLPGFRFILTTRRVVGMWS